MILTNDNKRYVPYDKRNDPITHVRKLVIKEGRDGDLTIQHVQQRIGIDDVDEDIGVDALDRSTPQKVDTTFGSYFTRGYVEQVIRKEGGYDMHTPYAITFTFPVSYRIKKNPVLLCDMEKYDQYDHFLDLYNAWLKLLKRKLKSVMSKVEIPCHEVYCEYTKSGLIHAHGLIYINNNYFTAVREIMAQQWKETCKGAKKSAMVKRKGENTDHAFDKCNNVKKWREYITKEYPKYALLPTGLHYTKDPNPDGLIQYDIEN